MHAVKMKYKNGKSPQIVQASEIELNFNEPPQMVAVIE
jgi:hypothetical protein